MSRVHDALRRAEMGGLLPPEESGVAPMDPASPMAGSPEALTVTPGLNGSPVAAPMMAAGSATRLNLHPAMLSEVQVVAFDARARIPPARPE